MHKELKKQKESTVIESWKGEPEDISPYYGFIYKITHLPTNKFYIGKKFFWFKHSRNPLKGKKRKRRYLTESDWRTYWSSCLELQALIEEQGISEFKREILFLCKDKFECAYYEVKAQIEHNVLFDCNCFNKIINCRIRRVAKDGDETESI